MHITITQGNVEQYGHHWFFPDNAEVYIQGPVWVKAPLFIQGKNIRLYGNREQGTYSWIHLQGGTDEPKHVNEGSVNLVPGSENIQLDHLVFLGSELMKTGRPVLFSEDVSHLSMNNVYFTRMPKTSAGIKALTASGNYLLKGLYFSEFEMDNPIFISGHKGRSKLKVDINDLRFFYNPCTSPTFEAPVNSTIVSFLDQCTLQSNSSHSLVHLEDVLDYRVTNLSVKDTRVKKSAVAISNTPLFEPFLCAYGQLRALNMDWLDQEMPIVEFHYNRRCAHVLTLDSHQVQSGSQIWQIAPTPSLEEGTAEVKVMPEPARSSGTIHWEMEATPTYAIWLQTLTSIQFTPQPVVQFRGVPNN